MRQTSKNRKVEKSRVGPAAVLFAAFGLLAGVRGADEKAAPEKPRVTGSAPELVHRGNQLLLSDKPADAIELYDEAQKADPDAREIAFGKGLGYYKLGEFDKARAAFEEAAGAKSDALADDALYSIGTVDHAQALASQGGDPKAAIGKLESAMQSYQSVLARDPQHAAARDANLKAATMWRQIKEQMQQQQQQQSDQNQDQNKDQQDQQQQQQQDQQDQEKQDQEKQDQQSQQQDQQQEQQQPDQQQEQQQQQQSQQNESQEEQEQKEQQSAEQQKQEEQDQQQEAKQQASEEQISREQAERQLREMLQALRDRKKERHEQAKPMPVQRNEKDW